MTAMSSSVAGQAHFESDLVVSKDVAARKADTAALDVWLAQTRTEIIQDDDEAELFVLSIERWLRAVPRACWPMAMAWFQAILKHKRKGVSPRGLRILRGAMRRDVNETVAELRDASRAVVRAWRDWYPKWVEDQIAHMAEADPELLLTSSQVERKARRENREAARRRDQVARLGSIGRELVEYANQTSGGLVIWEPNVLREKLRDGSVRKPSRQAIRRAADALVQMDLAQWKTRSSGQAWALQVLVPKLPAETT